MKIKNKNMTVPIIQGGMGVGVSGKKLATGVQMATRFIATNECDASEVFKQVIVEAKKEDVVIIKSPVGMPARAIKTPFVERMLRGEAYPPKRCNGCLSGCPGADKTPYCISRALIAAVTGDYENGLFFCSGEVEKTNQMMSVSDLIDEIERERNA